jgi:type I restriction enzyme S subunit
MSFPRYPTYKDSGVEWLGEVPEHWEVTALKHGYVVTLGKMLQPEAASEGDMLLPYLRAANIRWSGIDDSDIKTMWFSTKDRENLRLQVDDLLVSEGGDVGRSALWKGEIDECYFQNSVNRVRPDNGNLTSFLRYWMSTMKDKGYIDVLCNKSTIAHFTAEKVGAVPVPLPPVDEQNAIATFLDHETAKIDALIAEQQRLIELLQEKRQAVISHAVTKGLNPDAPMKDSGVEWLEEVPEHWEVRRLKNLLTRPLQYGANEAAELDDPDLPRFVRITDIDETGRLRDDTFRSLPHDIAAPYLLEDGDVLLARSGATVGKSFIYSREWGIACFAGYLIRARMREVVCRARWLHFYCQTLGYWAYVGGTQIQATIQNVNAEKYANLWLPVPPPSEQVVIMDKLAATTNDLDNLTAEAMRAINLLQERRSALISAAVTGQIDVRGLVAEAKAA